MTNTKSTQQVVIDTDAQEPVPVVLTEAPGETAIGPMTPAQVHASPLYATVGQGTVLAPVTTEQEQIVTAGQRRINIIWEITQASIALLITGSIIYTATHGISNDTLANAFFLIIGTYFTRLNHVNIGGVGAKATDAPYRGR